MSLRSPVYQKKNYYFFILIVSEDMVSENQVTHVLGEWHRKIIRPYKLFSFRNFAGFHLRVLFLYN